MHTLLSPGSTVISRDKKIAFTFTRKSRSNFGEVIQLLSREDNTTEFWVMEYDFDRDFELAN